MPTLVGTEADAVRLLHNLIQLDFDAIAAYELAIGGLEEDATRRRLAAFRDDHRAHTERLGALLTELDEEPPTAGDSQMLLTTGQVMMALPFGDRAILQAMAVNEDDTNTAYRRANAHKGVDGAIRQALVQSFADEQRHAAWIEQRLRQRTH